MCRICLQAWNCGVKGYSLFFFRAFGTHCHIALQKHWAEVTLLAAAFRSVCFPTYSPAWHILPVALFSVLLLESCASPAKVGRGGGQRSSLGPQSWSLGHPQGGLLPTLLSAPALPTEAGPVAQLCLVSLWGWGAVSLRVKRREASSWQVLCWERGVSVGMLGGRKSPDPLPHHRKFCSISSRAGWRHPAWRGGRVIDNPSRPQTQARAETTHTNVWGRGLNRNPGQYTQDSQVFAFKN